MNPIWFLYFFPIYTLDIPWPNFGSFPSFSTKHQPVYRRGIAWSWFRASVLRQFAQALWVLPHLQAIFKGSLKFLAPTTTNNNQQPTTNPQPQTSQPTNQQNQSCEPTSWVDAVVLASDNATSSWFDVQMPEDIRKNDQRPPVVLFAPSSVSPSHPCRQPGKYVQSFQQTLFWASYSRSKSHCENSPNQSSLLRQVEVFFLMILPAPQVFQL